MAHLMLLVSELPSQAFTLAVICLCAIVFASVLQAKRRKSKRFAVLANFRKHNSK